MSTRCSCPDQGDAVVFGECRKCMPNPEPPRSPLTDLPRLVPSSWFVVPPTSEGVAADNLQQQLDELEPRYLETLDADERGGR